MLLANFGESITYFPQGGGSRPIQAIIDRDPPAIFDAAGNAVLPVAMVRVYNSCRSGISSHELDTGTDEIEFPLRIGDTLPKRFSVMQMQTQDSGVVSLALK
jgi:hypothetical protein